MYQTQYRVTLTYEGANGATMKDIFDGDNPGAGATAYQQLLAGEDINVTLTETEEGESGEVTFNYVFFVPFHSVHEASIYMIRAEVEKPEDETCQ